MKKHLLAAGLRRVGHGHVTVNTAFINASTAAAVSHYGAKAEEAVTDTSAAMTGVTETRSSEAASLPKNTPDT